MSAIVSSQATKSSISVDGTSSHRRKTRIVRRRGRAVLGVESDDEIEREVTSDDDTDDDRSSVESESETESLSDDHHLNGRSEVVTPSTTQSPPPPEIDGRAPLTNEVSSKPADTGPFVAATDWAEMVTAEHANGAEELPVIDFADLDRHRIDQHLVSAPRARKAHKQGNRKTGAHRSTSAPPTASPVPSSIQQDDQHTDTREEEPVASTSDRATQESNASRVRGQSARQAYKERLETDPSFVPKVGEFWGHDDRLLAKDLRSLSGWWRGRWQSRGRGRGAFNLRGRGGRGFASGRTPGYGIPEGGDGETDAVVIPDEVPPVDKAWTHDGFEEMKRRDERRREHQDQRMQEQKQPNQQVRFGPQRGFGFRGRGGFFSGTSRGRGAFASPPTSLRSGLPPSSGTRLWYAMKPERTWTKHHEAFLYFDPTLKPRPGQGPGFRVKLPGGPDQLVRAPPRSYPISKVGFTRPMSPPQDDSEKLFTIRIPRRAGKEKAREEIVLAPIPSAVPEELATTVAELSIDEVFTVRPHVLPNRRLDLPIPSKPPTTNGIPPTDATTSTSLPVSTGLPLSQGPSSASSSKVVDGPSQQAYVDPMLLQPPIPRHSDSSPSPLIKDTVLRRPSLSTQAPTLSQAPEEEVPRPAPPVLHPLQTTFSPVPQTSPPYGSPYTYGPGLPPGIGMSQHGMPYELATGRPVYLQQTPPPMFTPRPMMHAHMAHPSASVPFVPTHMHHHSNASPDFLTHPHTPPVGTFIDPSTGVPIFAPARQSSRIEIRAPTDAADGRKQSARPSGLRMTASSSEGYENGTVPQDSSDANTSDLHGDNGFMAIEGHPAAHAVEQQMAYPSYQQPYYYPEAYAYPAYMDMSPQVMQYDMYAPPDHRSPQPPMIYY